MNTISRSLVLALTLSMSPLAACMGGVESQTDKAPSALADAKRLRGKYQFVFTDERRGDVEAKERGSVKSESEVAGAMAEADAEAAASDIEFGDDGVFHSRVYGKEIAQSPYSVEAMPGGTLRVSTEGAGGKAKSVVVRLEDADTIVIEDPEKGDLTFRRQSTH